MDCGAFHKNLEDYLQGGLDYAGRLGMERHGEQCFRCGQELAQALELHEMAAGLRAVAAPNGFEDAVLQRIRADESRGRSWSLYRDWIYGFEWANWRRIAIASSGLAVIVFAGLFLVYRSASDRGQLYPLVSGEEPLNVPSKPQNNPVIPPPSVSGRSAMMARAVSVGTPAAVMPQPAAEGFESGAEVKLEPADAEFMEYRIVGPDDRPFVVRLPKTIRMKYGQPSEEYFIRYVSH